MPSKASSQCTTRRKQSLGKLRRAHPASGATWNVQVVRGKMSSKCLWHACRALILGIILMLLGAGMATVGYYADQLSIGSEIRGNSTVRVKNESKGFHLNNLSYVGPIVMGFGGFIVVASCVMTFEARDSAAKVVPARLKAVSNSKMNIRSNSSSASSQRRANGVSYQNTRWDHHLGVFRSSPAEPPPAAQLDRQALTAALVHFSKTLGYSSQLPSKHKLPRCGSVPNLSGHSSSHMDTTTLAHLLSPNRKLVHGTNNSHRRHRHHHHASHQVNGRHPRTRSPRLTGSLIQRTSRESSSSLLQPTLYQKQHWNAMSVDETEFTDSLSSRYGDQTKRSDTAKRHLLLRQQPIENEDLQTEAERRRSSTLSDLSYGARWSNKCSLNSALRTQSIDSKKIQVDLHSPQSQRSKLTKRVHSGPSSTPSVEREFRSQLSICSEPITARQLSGQSSIEPCVLEENQECDEKPNDCVSPNNVETKPESLKKTRPETLPINSNMKSSLKEKSCRINKELYRSNSSHAFYRPNPGILNKYESTVSKQIAGQNFVSNNEVYDSLQVINERRKKILKAESETTLLKNQLEQDSPKPFEVSAEHKAKLVTSLQSGRLDSESICDSPSRKDEP